MMTWKQKCKEERFYEVRRWRWNSLTEEYDIDSNSDLTFEEAKKLFDDTEIGCIYDQVDIYREWSEDYIEKIAVKDTEFETWDRNMM